MLDVEGAVGKAKLDEFQNTNVALMKERDDLRKRLEGIEPNLNRHLPSLPLQELDQSQSILRHDHFHG